MPDFMRLKHLVGVHSYHIPEKGAYGARKGCHDQIRAWEHFGGLTLEEAYEQFCARPEIYQEDFMFMGWTAFRYYFPVIETYLHEAKPHDEFDECQAWILATIISFHWEQADHGRNPELIQRLANLCAHVRSHLDRYTLQPERQKEIDIAWAQLEDRIRNRA